MSESAFDLVVIGAGPGGYAAAVRASELGMKVACVDRDRLGGTCLNVGCIPSKALLESSERYRELSGAGLDAHGIQVGEVRLDLAAMMARKQKIVDTMTEGIGGLFRKHKVELLASIANGVVALTIAPAGERAGESRVEECDCVLVAVGRRPDHEGSGIEALGVAVDDRGYVVVDGDFQTNVPGVYAVGDLIPGPMLAHKAEMEGVVAVERMAGMGSRASYRAIPNVVYPQPEVASVGATEEQAAAEGLDYSVGKFQFRANARAHCMDAIDGLVKIVAATETDRLLGMHILGPQASHLIAEGALAIEFSASAEDVARTVHAHPSLSEVVGMAAGAASVG